MRVFLTLCSLVAVGLAKPQYNYGSGVSGSFDGSSSSVGAGLGGFGAGSLGAGSSFGAGSVGAGSALGGSFGSGAIGGGASFGSGSIGGGSSFGGSSYGGASHGSHGFEAPLVHKQFITVGAPEDHDSLERTKHLVIGRPQKNYRVVFIKAPSTSNANVRLSAEYAPKEEKTVIYVLSKKDNQLEVNDIATPAPTVPSKPEVFFIKYKTDAEAQHAQRQIQAEYDRIEGSSEHTDAGVAPQQSVVGILGNGGNAGAIGGGSFGGVGSSGSFGAGSGSFGAGSSGSFGAGSSSGSFGAGSGSFGAGSSGSFGSGTSADFGSSGSVVSQNAVYLPPSGH